MGKEKLRCGYTTGTCAAAAAAGAARLLLTGETLPAVRVDTPAGITGEADFHVVFNVVDRGVVKEFQRAGHHMGRDDPGDGL